MARVLVIPTRKLTRELGERGMARYLAGLGDVTAQTETLEEAIKDAQSEIEKDCGISLTLRRYKSNPVSDSDVRGTHYDVIEDAYPFIRPDWGGYATVKLRKRPIERVYSVLIRYGVNQAPMAIITFPDGWIAPERKMGRLNIMPIAGGGSASVSAGLLLLPIMGAGIGSHDSMPLLVAVDYTAGYLPADFNAEEDDPDEAAPDNDCRDVLRAVTLVAARNMLRAFARVVAPGGGSIAMGRFNRSYQGARFDSDIAGYDADIVKAKERINNIDGPINAFLQ